MADATPFGVPVDNLKRWRVTAYKQVEIEIEAFTAEQAQAQARYLCARDKLIIRSVEDLRLPAGTNVPSMVADKLADTADKGDGEISLDLEYPWS